MAAADYDGDGDVDLVATYQGVAGSLHVSASLPRTHTLSGMVSEAAPNARPIVGARIQISGGGHTFSWQGEGVQRFQFHGEGGEWWESGPGQTATATHVVVDGVAQPDFSNVGPPIAGSYTCSGSNLRMTAVDPVDLTEIFRK